MKHNFKILAFSGSLRKGSYNLSLLKTAKQHLTTEATMDIFDISDIPLFNMDLKMNGEPESVQEFKSAIKSADALLIATPEYNASIPGVLKNALDWASHPRSQSPLANKPTAIIGAGGTSGTKHAQKHLREVAEHLKMKVLDEPELLVTRAWEKFDDQGNLVDAATISQVKYIIQALITHASPDDIKPVYQFHIPIVHAHTPA